MNNRKIKVCILGASGFVGRALYERFLKNESIEVTAVIRSPGNAWSILRHNTNILVADVLDLKSIENAVKGSTHVVNLALGPFNTIVEGLKNTITACEKYNIERLVHISSVTVYGDFPDPESEFEGGPVLAKKETYGWFKAKQDELVEKANSQGLSSIVLCPPHITGAYGRIFHAVVDTINKGSFALVEEGKLPCNLVDVNNFCDAVELSLFVKNSDGRRIFITNDDSYTWKDLAIQAANLTGIDIEKIPRITYEQCLGLKSNKLSFPGLIKNVFRIPEVKTYARGTIIAKNRYLRSSAKRFVKVLSGRTEEKTQLPLTYKNSVDLTDLNADLCRQQLRGVQHKIDRAKTLLNYQPRLNSDESFEVFKDYYTKLYGYGTEYWHISD